LVGYVKMSQQPPGNWKIAQDTDLLAWLATDSRDTRELMVEARLPARKVTIQKHTNGRMVPAEIDTTAADAHTAALAELHDFLSERLDTPPVLLKAVGAIAVRATSQQVRQFVDHPLVKAIRPNRKLR
jgi:hypothetical protein